jgi:triosephosphate isomerase (TIM)
MSRIPVYAANWKMNKALAEVEGFVGTLRKRLSELPRRAGVDYETVVAPTALHLPLLVKAAAGSPIQPSAQNCGYEKAGAFTGEISPETLKELGCPWVILGHSERRHVFQESDALIAKRLKAALDCGLKVILCVGEKLEARQSGKTLEVVAGQLSLLKDAGFAGRWDQLVLAYEPVWAIGTGETATPAQAQEAHAFIRKWVSGVAPQAALALRILYGGSANAANSAVLMRETDVDGLLVGGASLDANSFADLIRNGLGLPA